MSSGIFQLSSHTEWYFAWLSGLQHLTGQGKIPPHSPHPPQSWCDVSQHLCGRGQPYGASQAGHPGLPTLGFHPEPRLFFCLLSWHIPYHFHKMGLASGGRGGRMSRDTDTGFLGVADQEHNPSRFCHEVASCNYEPADRAQALLRGKHLFLASS